LFCSHWLVLYYHWLVVNLIMFHKLWGNTHLMLIWDSINFVVSSRISVMCYISRCFFPTYYVLCATSWALMFSSVTTYTTVWHLMLICMVARLLLLMCWVYHCLSFFFLDILDFLDYIQQVLLMGFLLIVCWMLYQFCVWWKLYVLWDT